MAASMPGGKKWTSDGVPLEDTNCASIGSDEDKAQTEPAWQNCGMTHGIDIWRIEQFEVKAWPTELYGQFHKGDSYIVLHTIKKENKLERRIFFWLGSETTTDEMGCAAYKTVELDDFFDGEPSQHREVEGSESQEFKRLFPRLKYLEGGIETGFVHVQKVGANAKLYIVKRFEGSRQAEILPVPCERDSLNDGDCFIMQTPQAIYRWEGRAAANVEKFEANRQAENLEHGSVKQVLVDDLPNDGKEFWDHLGGKGPIKPAEDVTDGMAHNLIRMAEQQQGQPRLFQISNEPGIGNASGELQFKQKQVGNLKRSMLISDDVMLVDAQSEIFLWVGRGANNAERRSAFGFGIEYLRANNRPTNTPIHTFKEDQPINNEIWAQVFGEALAEDAGLPRQRSLDGTQSVADFSDADYVGRAVAVKDHIAADEGQLSVRAGDVVYVLEVDPDGSGWWGGHKEGDLDVTGWFPGNILASPLEPVVTCAAQADGSGAARRSQPPAADELGPDSRSAASPQRQEALTRGAAAEDAGCVAADGGCLGPPCARGDQGAAAIAAVSAGGADACLAGVRAERDQLRADVGALHGELHKLKGQSVADRTQIRELEQLLKNHASAQARQQRKLEQQFREARDQMRADVGALHGELRELKGQSVADRARIRELEQLLKLEQAGQQLELEQQLREARGELDRLRRERAAAAEAEAARAEAEAARAREVEGVRRWQASASACHQRGTSPGPSRTALALAAAPSPARERPLPGPSDQQPAPRQPRPQSRPCLPQGQESPKAGSVLQKVFDIEQEVLKKEERCRSQRPVQRMRSAVSAVRAVHRARSAPRAVGAPRAAPAPTAEFLPSRVAAVAAPVAPRAAAAEVGEEGLVRLGEAARGAGCAGLPGREEAALGRGASAEQPDGGHPDMGMSPLLKAAGEAGAFGFSPDLAASLEATLEASLDGIFGRGAPRRLQAGGA